MIDAWLGRFSKYTSYSQIDIKVSHSLSLTKTLLEMIELFQYSAQCAFLVKGLQKMNRPMLVSFHSFHLWLFPTWRQCHSRCRCCTCTFYSILFVCLYFAPVSRNFASLSLICGLCDHLNSVRSWTYTECMISCELRHFSAFPLNLLN